MSRPWWPFRPRFLSLTWKLTLAFLLVGILGLLIFTVLLGQRTRVEFDRFLSNRDQTLLINTLTNYYRVNGSWEGVTQALADTSPLDFISRNTVIMDAKGQVLSENPTYARGQVLTHSQLEHAITLSADGNTVGYVIFTPFRSPHDAIPSPRAAEQAFLRRIMSAAAASAALTGVVALVLGGLLARTLTRPMRELTAATKAMAGGELHQQVTVRSYDEIGQLANSFNQMSSDLAHASQLRKQMTADLAHDLRTPLAILRGYIEGLKEGRIQGSPALFGLLFDEVEHLQRLIEDLRVLSLADAGELSLNRRLVDPAALLERAGLAHMVRAEDQGVELRVESSDTLPSISVDTDRMAQVLNNLVANALRHTVTGEVVLAADTVDQQVRLTVHDTGTGIAPDDLPFVFDRFYRADKSRQRADGNSSGLGLAIAKAIVEAHGGSLTVDSIPGQGSTFVATLPIAQAA